MKKSSRNTGLLLIDSHDDGSLIADVKTPGGPVLQLFRSPFKWLFFGNLLSAIGFELRLMAQSWLILELGGSQVWVGAATGLRVVPFLLASLVAGVLIDRIGGRTILLWDRLGLLLLAAATYAIVALGVAQVWQVVALSIAVGGVIALGMPSATTLVSELVPPHQLQTANSLNTLGYSIARALGPMGGGVLIATVGLSAPWVALMLLFALSALCTLQLPKVEKIPATVSAWTSLVAGFNYVRSHPIVSRVMLIAFSIIVGSSVMPIWPIYARDRFDVGGTGFGYMMAAFALGQGISALYVANRRQWTRLSTPILCASMIWGTTMIAFGFSTSYPLTLAVLFVMGTAVPLWVTSVVTILQTQTDRPMLGRVMAVYAMSMQVGMIGALFGAWLGQLIGNDWMLLLTGSSFVLLNFGIIFSSRDMRQI
jgi:MFS family permease